MNGHSALDAAERKASGLVLLVLEDGHTTMLDRKVVNHRINQHYLTFKDINKAMHMATNLTMDKSQFS